MHYSVAGLRLLRPKTRPVHSSHPPRNFKYRVTGNLAEGKKKKGRKFYSFAPLQNKDLLGGGRQHVTDRLSSPRHRDPSTPRNERKSGLSLSVRWRSRDGPGSFHRHPTTSQLYRPRAALTSDLWRSSEALIPIALPQLQSDLIRDQTRWRRQNTERPH